MTVPTITTLPPAPSRSGIADFTALANPFLAGIVTFQGEVSTAITWLNSTSSTVAVNAAAANTSALSAAASATLASSASGATLHVPSASYDAGDAALSNVDYAAYRCILTHTDVATDPSADTTNWTPAIPASAAVGDVKLAYAPPASQWLELNGQALSKTSQSELFGIFGESAWGYDTSGGNPYSGILPDTAPTGAANALDLDPTETYVAVAHNSSPFVTFYDWNAGAPTKLANPAVLPTGAARAVKFSPNGNVCAVAHDTSPYVTFYDTSTPSAPVKLANPATLPPANGYSVSWTPDGRYCAVAAYAGSNCMTIYDFNSGSPVKVASVPTSQPSSTGWSCEYSPNGTYLAVGSGASPFIALYNNASSASPSRMADPAVLPSTIVKIVRWSPDSRYLAAQENGAGQIIYDLSSGTPVEVTFDTEPTQNYGITWLSNTRVAWTGSSIEIYEISAGVATLQAPAFGPNLGYNTKGNHVFADGSYILSANATAPYFTARVRNFDISTHFQIPDFSPENYDSTGQSDAPTAYVKGE